MLFVVTMLTALAAAPGTLAGTWVHSGGQAELDKKDAAVEATAQTFNFAFRPIARGALGKTARLDERITIAGDEKTVEIVFRGENDRESVGPSDGTPTEVRGATVTFLVETDTRMTIDGKTSDGGKKAIYTLTGPDTMVVSHEVTSGRLDGPMTWTLTYRRQ
jgi:hypothetical protein